MCKAKQGLSRLDVSSGLGKHDSVDRSPSNRGAPARMRSHFCPPRHLNLQLYTATCPVLLHLGHAPCTIVLRSAPDHARDV